MLEKPAIKEQGPIRWEVHDSSIGVVLIGWMTTLSLFHLGCCSRSKVVASIGSHVGIIDQVLEVVTGKGIWREGEGTCESRADRSLATTKSVCATQGNNVKVIQFSPVEIITETRIVSQRSWKQAIL